MMTDDSFEMVAIVYSQPEAAVMLSMFAFYGIRRGPWAWPMRRRCRP